MGIVLVNLIEKLLSMPVEINGNELLIKVKEKEKLKKIIKILKKHSEFQYTQLIDLFGIDYIARKERFEIHYVLWSFMYNNRIRIKRYVDEKSMVESISDIYPSANWLEREVWDMYGIYFIGHPDLRRILTDYGFEGFPLRKDFPVTGFLEMRYSESDKRIIYEPVELTQEYRLFHFLSPWEKK